MRKMYCTKCGYELERDSMFCPNCGEKLDPISRKPYTRSTVKVVAAIVLIVSFLLILTNTKSDNIETDNNTDICSECNGDGFLLMTCNNCDGGGTVDCTECSGSGRIQCNWCFGQGGNECISCSGSG